MPQHCRVFKSGLFGIIGLSECISSQSCFCDTDLKLLCFWINFI